MSRPIACTGCLTTICGTNQLIASMRLLDQFDRSRPRLITTTDGKQLTEPMLRQRFEPARKRAADKALENGDPDLAAAIMQFQFRDIRPKAAS